MPRTNAEVAGISRRRPLDLTGALSIIESAAVLKRCEALVTNDSAPLHLAEAVGTPVDRLLRPDGAGVRLFSAAPGEQGSRNGAPLPPLLEKRRARLPVRHEGMPHVDQTGARRSRRSSGARRNAGALMRIRLALYNALLPAAALAARVAAPFNAKIAEGLRGREGFRTRWKEKAAALERKGQPRLVSRLVGRRVRAGEAGHESSRREQGPSLEIALTFFSPSGMHYYERFDRSKRIPAIDSSNTCRSTRRATCDSASTRSGPTCSSS